jgi:LacI family transcriptional regulator
MNERVTMAVIAKRAGVHTTTVSLALRNHPSLPVRTRTRLQALAAEMGYQPDPALSALVAYRRQVRSVRCSPLLAYVTNWDTRWGWRDSPAHRDFFAGASTKAAALGYQLDHFWLREPGLTARRLSRILFARGVTGIVLASHLVDQDEGPLDFEWSKFSGVKIDFAPRGQQLHTVTNDQRKIVTLAVRRIRAAGYKRIGYVMPAWWDAFVDHAWSAGFLAMQQLMPRADRIPILAYPQGRKPGDYSVPRPLLSRWLATHRPEVIMSYAPFVCGALQELGWEIPRDVAFVETFLDQPDGRVAGVHENCQRVGELAIDILSTQLQQNVRGVPEIPTVTLVEGSWCDGDSLPPAKAASARADPCGAGEARPMEKSAGLTPEALPG